MKKYQKIMISIGILCIVIVVVYIVGFRPNKQSAKELSISDSKELQLVMLKNFLLNILKHAGLSMLLI